MPFSGLAAAQLGRSLAQIAREEGDHVDVFLERLEDVELPEDSDGPGLLERREAGLAVRLLRHGRTWLAARDRIGTDDLQAALRQVARVVPSACFLSEIETAEPWLDDVEVDEMLSFPARLRQRIQSEHVAFPVRCRLLRRRRWVQVVGTRFVSEAEQESFYALVAELPWGRYGALFEAADDRQLTTLAEVLVDWFRARSAGSPDDRRRTVVLGPAATAVLLHEAVAHALEADTLALTGHPEAACGVQLTSELLTVLDDPRAAPEGLARQSDDEGMPTRRRWLLKQGEVREPLADLVHAEASAVLSPGAARRGSRHLAPVPRSMHLELVPGETTGSDLTSDARGGLHFPCASRGRLDPLSGELEVVFPFGRRIDEHGLGRSVGPCRLRGRVAEVLQSVAAVGRERQFTGAGWCAKGGHRLAVWATCPSIRLEGVEVVA